MPTGNPRITLPLLRLPCRRLCTSHAAWCGRVPDLTSVKNAEDVGPYHSGRFSYPRSNRNIRSFWLNPPHAVSDSATATACNVSSVIEPFFLKCRPPGSISVTQDSLWADPSRGAPNASPIASPTSDPAARRFPDINITKKVYVHHKKKNQLENCLLYTSPTHETDSYLVCRLLL